MLVQFLIGWLLVRFVFRKCGDVAVAAAAAAAAAAATGAAAAIMNYEL